METKEPKSNIKVVELFAGVGGFRLGLEGNSKKDTGFEVVWSNQWEPATKKQHASDIYVKRFGPNGHSNEDISKVPVENIPDHDLLVGGFPCQDYSVARTLSQSAGLNGKKGVLWWSIHNILKQKGPKAPSFLMLENVDRLTKSPASQRGRDFAIMLASLSDLGYAVEWRVVNAADYGMPQRRRRIYILGYKKGTGIHAEVSATDADEWLSAKGLHAKSFPILAPEKMNSFDIEGELSEITKTFNKSAAATPFHTAGLMLDRKVWTFKAMPKWEGSSTALKDIIEHDEEKIPKEYIVDDKNLKGWKYLKGGKTEKRETKSGFSYNYAEGPMVFPDSLDKPSRTIVTGEGGSTPSRFKHVIRMKSGKLRRLMPEELEKLNMFPVGHTKEETPVKRAFFMGNALVVGIVEKLGKELSKRASSKNPSANRLKASNLPSSRRAPKLDRRATPVS